MKNLMEIMSNLMEKMNMVEMRVDDVVKKFVHIAVLDVGIDPHPPLCECLLGCDSVLLVILVDYYDWDDCTYLYLNRRAWF